MLNSTAFKFNLFGLTGLYLYGQNDNGGGIKLKMDSKQEQGHFTDLNHKV